MEQEVGKETQQVAISIEPLNGAEPALSEAAAIELRRKLNMATAIMRAACPMFSELLSLQNDLERRRSHVPLVLLIAALAVGAALHFAFADPGAAFGFTFGMFIAAYGFVGWVLHGLATHRKAERLREVQRAVAEMLYRWMANGGHEERFWQLRDQVHVDLGAVDAGTEDYQRWWHQMKGDLLESIKGDTPAVAAWKASPLFPETHA